MIREAGMSHKGLAGRVVKLGELRGIDLRYNHSSVVRWLRGQTPHQPTPQLIAQALSDSLGRRVSVAEIGMATREDPDPDAALHLTLHASDSAHRLAALAHADMQNRRALLDAGFDLTVYSSAALRWLVAPRTTLTEAGGSRRIGPRDVEEIREATRAFRVLDNSMGGGRIRTTM